ncbi:MAG: carboxypeptidase-like regulatory domain-containing protein [Ginsengibacter sp.]
MRGNKTYTASDFQRYHSGTMPAGEMHSLEKASLEDPFLADALEGYIYANAAEGDIAEMKERLDKKNKKKVFSIFSFAQNGWWRIAALFIIVAGAGYFFFRINDNTKNVLAKNNIESSAQNKSDINQPKNDSIIANDISTEKQLADAFEQRENTPIDNTQIKKEAPVILEQQKAKTAPALVSKPNTDSNHDYVYKEAEYKAKAPAEYVLKGKVTDNEGKAVAFASIKTKTGNTQTVTDTAGHFFSIPGIAA